MLRVHFLNVGHGDCTIIEHPSGRITMIDCNASGEYDGDSLNEYLAERRPRQTTLRGLMAPGGIAGFPSPNPLGAISPGHNPFGVAGDLQGLMSGVPSLTNELSAPRGLAFPAPSPASSGILAALAEIAAIEEAKNGAKKEVTDPVAFMRLVYPGRRIWRFVLTHPDLDHMRGLKKLHREIGIDNFWDIVGHTKASPDFRADADADREEWRFYQQLRAGNIAGLTPLRFRPGDRLFAFGRDEAGALGGDNIEILSPIDALVDSCNAAEKSNDLSYVLRVQHAGRSLLLPGDAEEEAWDTMRAIYGAYLKSDVLKASHHGRDSGYNLDALRLIAPSAVVVSVGRKPPTDASRKYHAQCGWVVSTRYYGNIELQMLDNGALEWFAQRNAGNP